MLACTLTIDNEHINKCLPRGLEHRGLEDEPRGASRSMTRSRYYPDNYKLTQCRQYSGSTKSANLVSFKRVAEGIKTGIIATLRNNLAHKDYPVQFHYHENRGGYVTLSLHLSH